MRYLFALLSSIFAVYCSVADELPWSHGSLCVTTDGAYLQHVDGTPFFWLADTGWLLPEKLNRDEVQGYLNKVAEAEFNVVQVQTINAVPAINVYGQSSHPHGWDFSDIDHVGQYGYWDHIDYIVDQARQRGIYVAMVCIWGGLVKSGQMDQAQARAYGTFLAERYGKCPNIVWVIGGDIRGDVMPQVWNALACSIKDKDAEHLMTFHPFGRTSSAYWWHEAPWLDFNMFQSGHRRYDQTRGDGDDTVAAAVAEDNWRYVADGIARSPRKPIIDGEPSYEDIPQGLHDPAEPRWQAQDVRRYAYWSVLSGAAGHTYGHNSVMQMLHPGEAGGYGATRPWYEAVNDAGYNQMKYLKRLMLSLDFTSYVPDQSVVTSDEGYRYDRVVSGRGEDYIIAYTYTNQPFDVNLTMIPGAQKNLWWYSTTDGTYTFIDTVPSQIITVQYHGPEGPGCDHVLIAKIAE